MAQTSKENLKKYFQTGDKPTQTEYAELIDAFRHVEDKLPITDIESLQASLDSKAAAATLLNHLNDNELHQSNMSGADIKVAYEAEADTNAFTDNEKQQVSDGVTHRADNDSHVSTSDKTKWNNQLKDWEAETLTAEMGIISRYYNGTIIKYVGGNLPFNTTDIEQEIIDLKWVDLIVGLQKPIIDFASPLIVGLNQTYEVNLIGWNFDKFTTVTIVSKNNNVPDLLPFDVKNISSNKISFFVTSNSDLQDYELIVTNLVGSTMHSIDFVVSTEAVLIPTALTWENITNEADTMFGNGSISPASLNQTLKTGTYTSFENGEDFDIIYKVEDIAVTDGTVSGSVIVEIRNDLGEFLTKIQKFTGLYYAVDNDWSARFQSNPQSKRYVLTRRVNGVVSFSSSDDGISWTTMRTLPNVYNGSITFHYSLPAHGGLSNIKFITKY